MKTKLLSVFALVYICIFAKDMNASQVQDTVQQRGERDFADQEQEGLVNGIAQLEITGMQKRGGESGENDDNQVGQSMVMDTKGPNFQIEGEGENSGNNRSIISLQSQEGNTDYANRGEGFSLQSEEGRGERETAVRESFAIIVNMLKHKYSMCQEKIAMQEKELEMKKRMLDMMKEGIRQLDLRMRTMG